jgi:hypothetical protein
VYTGAIRATPAAVAVRARVVLERREPACGDRDVAGVRGPRTAGRRCRRLQLAEAVEPHLERDLRPLRLPRRDEPLGRRRVAVDAAKLGVPQGGDERVDGVVGHHREQQLERQRQRHRAADLAVVVPAEQHRLVREAMAFAHGLDHGERDGLLGGVA